MKVNPKKKVIINIVTCKRKIIFEEKIKLTV